MRRRPSRATRRLFRPPWRMPPRTVRLRLTIVLTGLFLLLGTLLLTITYLLVARHPPVTAAVASVTPPAAARTSSGGPALASRRAAVHATARRERDAQLAELFTESGVALAIMTVLAAGLGWLVAGRVLRPLRAIAASMRHISENNLYERLNLPGPRDELKELSDVFDGLLERLQGAFDGQRQFVANASHELRTPLTVECAMIEVALADPAATADSLKATCRRVLGNAHDQERLIEAMLTLARSQRGIDQGQILDLAVITGESVHALGFADSGSRLECDLCPAVAAGDRHLIERLVRNLVDNALRYNVPGGWVRMRTWTQDAQAILRVTNSGPTIPADQIGALLQPFRRLPAGRAVHRDGLGLGLSIVAAIADAHHAAFRAVPGPEGGLDVTVAFANGPPGQVAGTACPTRGASRLALPSFYG